MIITENNNNNGNTITNNRKNNIFSKCKKPSKDVGTNIINHYSIRIIQVGHSIKKHRYINSNK